jgi:hypothetical protein
MTMRDSAAWVLAGPNGLNLHRSCSSCRYLPYPLPTVETPIVGATTLYRKFRDGPRLRISHRRVAVMGDAASPAGSHVAVRHFRSRRDTILVDSALPGSVAFEPSPACQGGWGAMLAPPMRKWEVGGTVSQDYLVPAQSLCREPATRPRREADLVAAARHPRILVLLPQGARRAREAVRPRRVVRLLRLRAQRQATRQLLLPVVRAGRRRAASVAEARRDGRPRAVARHGR